MPTPADGPLSWAADWARDAPDDIALVGPGAALTAAELWDTALRVSAAFADAGVAPGALVATGGPNALQPVLALGALAHGAVGVVLAPGVHPTAKIAAFGDVPGAPLERLVSLDLAALAAAPDPTHAGHAGFARTPDEPARIVTSSGTTGVPKSVVFTTAQLVERVARAGRSWIPEVAPLAVLLGPGSISGSVWMLAALRRRVPYYVPGDPVWNVGMLRDHGIRAVKGSPSQLAGLLASARIAGERLPDVQVVQSAGAPISTDLADDLADWFGAEVRSVYGATEVGAAAILRRPVDAGDGWAGPICIDAHVEVVDEAGAVVPAGDLGRVRIATDAQRARYLPGTEPPAGLGFVDDWFYPGDLGSVSGGVLTVVGREDDVINAAGVKVLPDRIEEAALRYRGIREAVACAVTDRRGVRRIALAFVGDAGIDATDLVSELGTRLGEATPKIVVRVAEVPKTESGKVKRGEVAELIQARLAPRIEI